MRLEEFQRVSGLTDTQLVERIRRHLPRGAKTTPSTLSRLKRTKGRKETRTASIPLALAIEKATEGKVRAEELPLSTESRRLLRQLRGVENTGPTDERAA